MLKEQWDGQHQHPFNFWIDQNVDWSSVDNAMGGFPSLVSGGTVFAEAIPGNQVWSATLIGQNILERLSELMEVENYSMVTVDGRTSRGDGMTTPELGQLMSDLGAVDAIGDGGGSTTMTIETVGLTIRVRYPSDNSLPDPWLSLSRRRTLPPINQKSQRK